ncbi:hypothetical protein XA68_14840 [Ophiocordyceps unilateralis]|uniref:C2H2-type domain-containing protein n=1 Tax=Ophiocordyceps unilateralis TaxID=268505 RepID=A0A2A9PM91_OPHUN|nr:hypothetical protein XA68_14840 [Ophiocordyceps unilateralis]
MGKKRRGHPDIEDVLSRPWCYYCERDFEDLKLLISHQKAKHFKCDRCGRRLNTAGGLSVHMNQVHKEQLHQVENSLPNRQGLDVEIFGMEGIPQEILDQHRNRIIQNFYQAQEDRRIATGNPLPGQGGQHKRKKIKMETEEELKLRVKEWRLKRKAEKEAVANDPGDATAAAATSAGAAAGAATATAHATSAQYGGQYQQPQRGYEQPPYTYQAGSPLGQPPGTMGAPPGLPQRLPDGTAWNAAGGDDIDRMIRMAEAGVKTAPRPEDGGGGGGEGEKKKKEKKGRLVYDDAEVSPEEKMAAMARYAFSPEVAA